jgi:hypothetical protein
MDTQVLWRKLKIPLIEKDYGDTAAEVLQTCALVAQYADEHTPEQIKEFQKQVEINPQVWLRLIALHKDERLQAHVERLPRSYTALYAISRMSDEEIEAAVQQGIIYPQASSHSVLAWTKEFRQTSGAEVPPWKCMVLPSKVLNPADISLLTTRFNQVAEEFGCRFVDASDYIPPKKDKYADRKALLPALQQELLQLLEPKYLALSEREKHSLGISCLHDCLQLDSTAFLKLLFPGLPAVGRLASQRKYEKDYVLKIAQEFILTDSRSTRFNLKRRLANLKESRPELAEVIDHVVETYMT